MKLRWIFLLQQLCGVIPKSCFQIRYKQIMSEEQNSGLQPDHLTNVPKRKRVPSQYASQIADFKNNYSSIPKKIRSTKALESPPEPPKNTQPRPMLCLLPSGRKLAVKVVVTSGKTKKIEKVEKKKSKPSTQSPPSAGKPKAEKGSDMAVTFFDKFLSVVEQIQKKSQPEAKENREAGKQNEEFRRRNDKYPRQREQKWIKSYQRMKQLGQKLDRLDANYVYLN